MKIKKFIGLDLPTGACNLRCEYCYVGNKGKLKEFPYTMEQMKKAFSLERLGGICFINICGDGEPTMNPITLPLIEFFLRDGHYVMLLTNGTLTSEFDNILSLDDSLLGRLFFKISFHYRELKKRGLLDKVFHNVERIKKSPCSLTVEYITSDEDVEQIVEMKELCMKKMHALPQLNIPRDERKHNLGVVSKCSLENYYKLWDDQKFNSEFFEFRRQFFGKKYDDYCYTGERQIWVNLATGFSHQCYHTPPLQDFMGEIDKPIRWLAVGNNCTEQHCYVTHSHITLGIVPYPEYADYRPTYADIRNRICTDGTEWVKPIYKEAFKQGVEQKIHSTLKKKLVNVMNMLLRMYRREYSL